MPCDALMLSCFDTQLDLTFKSSSTLLSYTAIALLYAIAVIHIIHETVRRPSYRRRLYDSRRRLTKFCQDSMENNLHNLNTVTHVAIY